MVVQRNHQGRRRDGSGRSGRTIPSASGWSGCGPDEAGDEVAGGVAAALDLAGLDVDLEAGEEVRDALVGEAALAQDMDLAFKQGDDFGASVALFVGAGGLAEFAGGGGDLVHGVGLGVG